MIIVQSPVTAMNATCRLIGPQAFERSHIAVQRSCPLLVIQRAHQFLVCTLPPLFNFMNIVHELYDGTRR